MPNHWAAIAIPTYRNYVIRSQRADAKDALLSLATAQAEAYVMMGQISSAILEYESILQRFPDDPDVLVALREIESKANRLNAEPEPVESNPNAKPTAKSAASKESDTRTSLRGLEDGRQSMLKIFVESKVITQGDFELCWVKNNDAAPGGKESEIGA